MFKFLYQLFRSLPTFFYRFSNLKIDNEKREVSYKKWLFWILPSRTISCSIDNGDWSIYVSVLKNRYLIVDGVKERTPSRLLNGIRDVMTQHGNLEAPLLHSDRFIRRLRKPNILQFGHKRLYKVDLDTRFSYSKLTFNKAKLTSFNYHILLNEYAFAYEKEKVDEIFNLLTQTIAYEGQLFFDKKFYFRKKYLLLGIENCYAEGIGTCIKDIVYFDRHNRFGREKVDFGNAAHFSYANLGARPTEYVFNYFVERNAPLLVQGTIIKSRKVLLTPLSFFFTSTIVISDEGVRYSRKVGWKKYKTSFIPYRDFYYVKLRGLLFFWSKIEAYGSQNVIPTQYFRSSDAKALRKVIFEKNPEIAQRKGDRYRTFRWLPFAPKEAILVVGSRVMYYHPENSVPICVKGSQLDSSEKIKGNGFWGWLLWRHVIADYKFDNIRYDETHISTKKLFEKSVEKYEVDEKKISTNFSIGTERFIVPHMWRRSATRLMDAIGRASRVTDGYGDDIPTYKEIYKYDDTNDPFHVFTAERVIIKGVDLDDEGTDVTVSVVESHLPKSRDKYIDTRIKEYVPTEEDKEAENVKFNMRDLVSQHKISTGIIGVLIIWWIISLLFTGKSHSSVVDTYSEQETIESDEWAAFSESESFSHDAEVVDGSISVIDETAEEQVAADDIIDEPEVDYSEDMLTAARLVFAMVLPQGVQSDDFETIVISKCTSSFVDALKQQNDFEDGSIAWWALRTMEQEGPETDSSVTSYTPDGNDAVIVEYSDMGHKATTRLEFVKDGNDYKVNSATVYYKGKNRTIK